MAKEEKPKKESNKKSEKSLGAEKKVKQGDTIEVEYTGSFDDGKVFDSSKSHGQPLRFEAGVGKVIPGFDKAVIGMKVGEEKTVRILPEEAYGQPNPMLVQKVPRSRLPPDEEPKAGMMLIISLPNGAQVPARISEVSGEEVTIDLNHPLAGKALNFTFKVVSIN